MGSKKLFRSSLFGFKKSDVMKYISELAAFTDQQRENLEKQLEEEKRANAELQSRLTAENKVAQELQDSLALQETKFAGLSSEYVSVREERDHLASKLAELQSKYEDITRTLADNQMKAENYDRQIRQIADVMIRAREDAEQVSERAQKNAESVRAALAKEVEGAVTIIEDMLEEFEHIRKTLDESINDFDAGLDNTDCRLSEVNRRFQMLINNFSFDRKPTHELERFNFTAEK